VTTPGTTTDAATAAVTSPVLGADPGRASGADAAADPTSTTSEPTATVENVAGPLPTVATYKDGDGRVHYASPFSKATRAHVAAGDWTEVDGSAQPFDPTTKRVRDVVAYLEEHAGDEDEVGRVKAAEAEGENRPTIAAWSAVGE
jgi:hypothetical protein